jgi:hypothetical protein
MPSLLAQNCELDYFMKWILEQFGERRFEDLKKSAEKIVIREYGAYIRVRMPGLAELLAHRPNTDQHRAHNVKEPGHCRPLYIAKISFSTHNSYQARRMYQTQTSFVCKSLSTYALVCENTYVDTFTDENSSRMQGFLCLVRMRVFRGMCENNVADGMVRYPLQARAGCLYAHSRVRLAFHAREYA